MHKIAAKENNNKSVTDQTLVVILAAGKGSRMGRPDLAKVCFEIDGVPTVNRLITTFKKEGFKNFMLVVGHRAQKVLDTVVAEHPEVMYVYQQPQLGTGHAAKIVSESLQNINYEGNVLVTMGDKFIENAAIKSLVNGFVKQQADMTMLTIPKKKSAETSLGRVFIDDTGQAIDIIEKMDLQRQAIVDELKKLLSKKQNILSSDVVAIIDSKIDNSKKQSIVVAELLSLVKRDSKVNKQKLQKIINSPSYNIQIGGINYSANQIDKKVKVLNASMYLVKSDAYYQGVSMIDNNNAQREYYLTDIVKHLGSIKDNQGRPKFKTRVVPIDDAAWVQAFNSPDELLSIQDYCRRKKSEDKKNIGIDSRPKLKANQYCTVEQWIDKIETNKPSCNRWLRDIYGKHEKLHEEKLKDLLKVLKCYGKKFGFNQKVCIVRAPGRVNLMGRHVDHRGGFTNFLAIDRETIAVAGLRDDNNVVAVNVEPKKFKPVKFNITELIGRFAWSDWINFVDSDWVRNMVYSTAGHWGNYIKAALLRLQHKYQDVKIKGMNLALTGNVPIAAGLSSSSTIVVATLQAGIAMNNFELTSQQFIDLCGEGEWFVGSRGGAGDHAAIRLGQRGKVAHVGYFPFRVEEIIEAPAGYQVMIANSHIKAAKSGSAKDMFNTRITAYNLGFELLKQRCPEIRDAAKYLRDITPENLGCQASDIYKMLLKVPQFITRKEFVTMLLDSHKELIDTNFSTHKDPSLYSVRGVLLYGIAEIMRSKISMGYLQKGRVADFGKLMKVSHDGDRVSTLGKSGKYKTLKVDCSDDYLNRLISDLKSEAPCKVMNAQLYMQPGSYACSTPEIDQMVDIACSVHGVAGAQIAGAGLGGCVMILAEKDSVGAVRKALNKYYYKPNKLKPVVLDCITVEGAGLTEF